MFLCFFRVIQPFTGVQSLPKIHAYMSGRCACIQQIWILWILKFIEKITYGFLSKIMQPISTQEARKTVYSETRSTLLCPLTCYSPTVIPLLLPATPSFFLVHSSLTSRNNMWYTHSRYECNSPTKLIPCLVNVTAMGDVLGQPS